MKHNHLSHEDHILVFYCSIQNTVQSQEYHLKASSVCQQIQKHLLFTYVEQILTFYSFSGLNSDLDESLNSLKTKTSRGQKARGNACDKA